MKYLFILAALCSVGLVLLRLGHDSGRASPSVTVKLPPAHPVAKPGFRF
jgi:hypothetical protein